MPISQPALRAVSVRQLLWSRFGWFFLGRTVDLAGSSMTTVALALAVLQASHNPSDLGLVLAANLIPTLVLLLLGGAVADRMSRKTLLIGSNGACAITMGAMAGLLITGHYSLLAIGALSLMNGAVSAFTSPALRGIVPELVEGPDLQKANALLATTRNSVRILAPALASIVVATAGGGWALAADALSFLLAALAFTRLPEVSRPSAASEPLFRTITNGWGVFRALRWVVIMTVSFALINAFNVGPWNVLGATIVSSHDGPVGWGVVQAVRATGLLAASVLAVKFVLRRPLRDGRLWGTLAALPLIAVGLSGEAWVVAAAAFIGGFGFTIAALTWETTLQSAVPTTALSRVAAYDDLFSFIAIPLSQVLVGPAAAVWGAAPVITTCGLAYIVASLLPLTNRAVRTEVT